MVKVISRLTGRSTKNIYLFTAVAQSCIKSNVFDCNLCILSSFSSSRRRSFSSLSSLRRRSFLLVWSMLYIMLTKAMDASINVAHVIKVLCESGNWARDTKVLNAPNAMYIPMRSCSDRDSNFLISQWFRIKNAMRPNAATIRNNKYENHLSSTKAVQLDSIKTSPKERDNDINPGIILIHVPFFTPVLYHFLNIRKQIIKTNKTKVLHEEI